MKECLRCGGSVYRDYAYGCDHQFWEDVIPEPEVFLSDAEDAPAWWVEEFGAPCARGWGDNGGGVVVCRGEQMHVAWASSPDGKFWVTYHPTREGARQLWREQYAFGLMVDSLFRKLTGWAKEGAELRAKRGAVRFHAVSMSAEEFQRHLNAYVCGDWVYGDSDIPSFQQYVSDEEVAEVESALARGGRMGSFSYGAMVAPQQPEHIDRLRQALEEHASPGVQLAPVSHAHAMSGTPKVPAGWPDNRTPEEKASAALVGRQWEWGSNTWTVTRAEAGSVWLSCFDRETGLEYDGRYTPADLFAMAEAYGFVEVTSE